jgi:hypothetical protein
MRLLHESFLIPEVFQEVILQLLEPGAQGRQRERPPQAFVEPQERLEDPQVLVVHVRIPSAAQILAGLSGKGAVSLITDHQGPPKNLI